MPAALNKLLSRDQATAARVMAALMPMDKLDIAYRRSDGSGLVAQLGPADAPAVALRAEAQGILASLDRYWLSRESYYRSRIMPPGVASTKMLDISVILAAVHAGDGEDMHSARDPRMLATLAKLEQLFDGLYPINRGRPRERTIRSGRTTCSSARTRRASMPSAGATASAAASGSTCSATR